MTAECDQTNKRILDILCIEKDLEKHDLISNLVKIKMRNGSNRRNTKWNYRQTVGNLR